MSATTKTHSFSLILSGVTEMTPEMAEALFEAGCDDSTPGSCEGVVTIDFDREAETLGDAIGSAVKDFERAGFAVARVEVGEGGP
jgi:hypothetical protein